jgi:hypothetical protein
MRHPSIIAPQERSSFCNDLSLLDTFPTWCVARGIVTELGLPIRPSICPICAAEDAFVEALRSGDEYYVECVNCGVYRASRRAFRHFEYLRGKADADSLDRLERLAKALNKRGRGKAIRLEYDDWQQLIEWQTI